MKLCIVGTGYVGLVTGTIFSEKGHEVRCIDIDQRKVDTLNAGDIPIYEPGLEELVKKNREAGRLSFDSDLNQGIKDAEIIFICVGTPELPNGAADLSYVESVARTIANNLNGYKLIVEKSTVPVKTGEKVRQTIERCAPEAQFDVASNPEFLKEGSAMEDALNPDRVVVGVTSDRAENMLRELYKDFPGEFVATDINSAELIKHASNSFLAMKISFINAVSNVCELSGANVEEVAKGMGLDKRIGPQFLRASLGYGGSCFPKDVAAFEKISEDLGYPFGLLREVQAVNERQIKSFAKRIVQSLWIARGKKIATLGVAFKANTDDIRHSPAVYVIEQLVEEGAHVHAFDPKADQKAREYFGDKITLGQDPYDIMKDANCLVILTEWPEFANLDLARVKELLAEPVILDGRNLYDPAVMREMGFDYRSIGRA